MGETTYRITQIEPQKHSKDRLNVYLNGAFAFGLEKEVLLVHGLHEGDEITDQLIDEVLLLEERTRAKKKALSLLAYRARSVSELKGRLKNLEFSQRTIDRVIADFLRVGLLDDRKFATAYVNTKMVQKPVGKWLLKQELLSKGISEQMAEEAIEEAYGAESELGVAKALCTRRVTRYQGESLGKMKKKLSAFLFRRGFNWEVIASVIEELK